MSLFDEFLDGAVNFIDEVVNDVSGQYSNNKLQVAVAGINVYETQMNLPVDSFKVSTKKDKPIDYSVSKSKFNVKGSYDKKNNPLVAGLGFTFLANYAVKHFRK